MEAEVKVTIENEEDAILNVTRFAHPKEWDGIQMTTVLDCKGSPEATLVAKMIINTVALLKAVEKNTDGNKDKCVWTLSEAAVIGEKVSFTLMAVSKEIMDLSRKEMKKEHAAQLVKDLIALMPTIPHPGGPLLKIVAHYEDGSHQTIDGPLIEKAVAQAKSHSEPPKSS